MPENPEVQDETDLPPIQALVKRMRELADRHGNAAINIVGGSGTLSQFHSKTATDLRQGANCIEDLVSIVEAMKPLIDKSLAVVRLADNKGMLFVTDEETGSDKLVGFFVPTYSIHNLSNAIKQAREAIQ